MVLNFSILDVFVSSSLAWYLPWAIHHCFFFFNLLRWMLHNLMSSLTQAIDTIPKHFCIYLNVLNTLIFKCNIANSPTHELTQLDIHYPLFWLSIWSIHNTFFGHVSTSFTFDIKSIDIVQYLLSWSSLFLLGILRGTFFSILLKRY